MSYFFVNIFFWFCVLKSKGETCIAHEGDAEDEALQAEACFFFICIFFHPQEQGGR